MLRHDLLRRFRPFGVLRLACVLALVATSALWPASQTHAADQVATIGFVSDTSWGVYDPGLTTSYGSAQDIWGISVCPAPESCHYSLAILAAFPGATWIWASGTTYDTLPADGVSYAFSKTIDVPGTPVSGSVSVAVDDLAEVYVNGQLVGTSGSVTIVDVASLAQRTLATFDLSPALISGPNVITVLVHNADWHNGACGPCVWGQNPGAVAFGGTIVYAPAATFAASVRPPVNADGSSRFGAKRGVVPVKFALERSGSATCDLPPATIAVTRLGGANPGPVTESVYGFAADDGAAFRVADCQYQYNLKASALGPGSYEVDILIDGRLVGSAYFQLE
jgi:hypothetical protein